MNTMSRLVVLTIMIAALLAACSGNNKQDGKTQQDVAVTDSGAPMTVKDTIEAMINTVMDYLRYKDKSILYANEFPYLRDEKTFDEYLQMAQVKYAEADTLTHVDIDSLTMYDHDSALANVTVRFLGPTGVKSKLKDAIVVYYQDGKWIKPTVGSSALQANYARLIRTADSAAAAEARGE